MRQRQRVYSEINTSTDHKQIGSEHYPLLPKFYYIHFVDIPNKVHQLFVLSECITTTLQNSYGKVLWHDVSSKQYTIQRV